MTRTTWRERRNRLTGGHPIDATIRVFAVLAFLLQIILEFRIHPTERFADLQVYLGAVNRMFDGGSLYDYQRHNGDIFTYPPMAGYLLGWLRLLAPVSAAVAWAVLTFAAFCLLARTFSRSAKVALETASASSRPVHPSGSSSLSEPQERTSPVIQDGTTIPTQHGAERRTLSLVFLLLVCTSPGRSNIAFGQISIIVVAMSAYDLLSVRETRSGWLLGLVTAIKLTPALFIPLLWFSGRRRAAVTAAAVSLLATVCAWVIRPEESVTYWLHQLPDGSRFVNNAIVGNQSIRASLDRAHAPAVTLLWLTMSAILIFAALYAGSQLARAGNFRAGVIVVGAASIAVSPISWTHHQFWLVLAVLLTIPRHPRLTHLWQAIVVMIISFGVLPISDIPFLRWVTANTHLLLSIACVLVGLLVRSRDRSESHYSSDITRSIQP